MPNGKFAMKTKGGYMLDEVVSSLQKERIEGVRGLGRSSPPARTQPGLSWGYGTSAQVPEALCWPSWRDSWSFVSV